MKLGNIKTEGQITWREWKKRFYEDKKEFRFGVLRLWKPNKFPSWRLDLFELKNRVKVRRHLDAEIGEELADELRKCGQDRAMRIVIRENGDIETEVIEAKGYAYRETDRYIVLQKVEQEEPF